MEARPMEQTHTGQKDHGTENRDSKTSLIQGMVSRGEMRHKGDKEKDEGEAGGKVDNQALPIIDTAAQPDVIKVAFADGVG